MEKCDIHYAMPDGEVLPFCTFNVFPEVYRDKIQKQYAYRQRSGRRPTTTGATRKDKYMRNVKELEATPLYQKTYGNMKDYFALAVNGGTPVKNFANVAAAPKKEVMVETAKGAVTLNAAESKGESGDSCGCGKSGGCGCSDKGAEAESGDSCGCGGGSCGC